MPVIFSDDTDMKLWLDVSKQKWSEALAAVLKPFSDSKGLVCYPVPKEVGKVGNQSSDFLKVCFPLPFAMICFDG